jgi:hypothetical protein
MRGGSIVLAMGRGRNGVSVLGVVLQFFGAFMSALGHGLLLSLRKLEFWSNSGNSSYSIPAYPHWSIRHKARNDPR